MSCLAITIAALALAQTSLALGPAKLPISRIVTFGDSYTDFIAAAAAGAQAWPAFTSQAGGFPNTNVAVEAGTCNSTLVSSVGPVLQVQIPRYQVIAANGLLFDKASTVYSAWIGSTDVSC